VGISLRKYSDDSFFVSHVERDGCLTSFEKILEKWLDGETENLQVDLVTRYNSPILLKVVDLLTKLNISVSSLTRAELTNTDQRHIVFEGSPAVENKKVCRLYFPYSYAQEARENWGSFSCKYLSGASLFVDAKEKFIGFEIPDPYLEMTFQLFGGELTDEEKDHFMSSNEFRIIENVNGDYYYVDCLELILSGKKDYLLRS
jgi:hypothetical protein